MQGRAQRCQGAGLAADALGQMPHQQRLRHKQAEQQPVRQAQRPWGKLHQQTSTQRTAGHAEQGGQAVDQRPLFPVDIQQRGPQHTGGHTGGKALQDPRRDQPTDTVGLQEQQHGDAFQYQRGKDQRPPPQVVRQRTDRQQRRQQAHGIHGEDQRQGHRRELPRLLVQVIQGRGGARRREKTKQSSGQKHQTKTPRGRGFEQHEHGQHSAKAII
ncbi:hypothetical protein D3C79_659400 [compost metagenome]